MQALGTLILLGHVGAPGHFLIVLGAQRGVDTGQRSQLVVGPGLKCPSVCSDVPGTQPLGAWGTAGQGDVSGKKLEGGIYTPHRRWEMADPGLAGVGGWIQGVGLGWRPGQPHPRTVGFSLVEGRGGVEVGLGLVWAGKG